MMLILLLGTYIINMNNDIIINQSYHYYDVVGMIKRAQSAQYTINVIL